MGQRGVGPQLQDPAEPGFDFAVYNLALITGEDNRQVTGVLSGFMDAISCAAARPKAPPWGDGSMGQISSFMHHPYMAFIKQNLRLKTISFCFAEIAME